MEVKYLLENAWTEDTLSLVTEDDHEAVENVDNAQYCEFFGQPAMLFRENLLKPHTEV